LQAYWVDGCVVFHPTDKDSASGQVHGGWFSPNTVFNLAKPLHKQFTLSTSQTESNSSVWQIPKAFFDGIPVDPTVIDRESALHAPDDPPIFALQCGLNLVHQRLAGTLAGTLELHISYRVQGYNRLHLSTLAEAQAIIVPPPLGGSTGVGDNDIQLTPVLVGIQETTFKLTRLHKRNVLEKKHEGALRFISDPRTNHVLALRHLNSLIKEIGLVSDEVVGAFIKFAPAAAIVPDDLISLTNDIWSQDAPRAIGEVPVAWPSSAKERTGSTRY
jgi:hypothetical protein